ncbi:sensor histidine kinase [Kibdelosporangium aridum]|uniref:sensor histidine kinase n=1 Tax=Kibdelosporangium aridum TaxID=2030 RepID=UPI000526ED55
MTAAGPRARRSVFVAEIVALTVAIAVDTVLALRQGRPDNALAAGFVSMVASVGPAVAVLAVLRRRFPRRIGRLGAAVTGLSLVSTASTVVASNLGLQRTAEPMVTEVLAAALLAGAGCRRLPPLQAGTLAAATGLAVVAAPVLRYGVDSPVALVAVPAALMWGVALAMGLVLRDADTRHLREVEQMRTNERLQLARELHDLVTHYVSGIVVRVQAAKSLAGRPDVPAQHPAEVYGEVEQAGTEALVAMRKLVGMLRSNEHALPLPSSSLGDIVRSATSEAEEVDIPEDVNEMPVPPELASTIHRVMLEATTNARRHAPQSSVTVVVRVANDEIVLDICNDMTSTVEKPPGYGLVGMTERVAALGGTLTAGPQPGNQWRVTARLPLDETALPRGV